MESQPARPDEPRLPHPFSATERRALRVVGLLLLPALFAVGWWLEPDARGLGTHEQLGFPPCGVLERTGWPCPGCGVTTAVAHATRGKLATAFVTQPFGVVLLCVAAVLFVRGLRGARVDHGSADGVQLAQAANRWPRALWRWAAPLGVLLLLSWAYKVARVQGWI